MSVHNNQLRKDREEEERKEQQECQEKMKERKKRRSKSGTIKASFKVGGVSFGSSATATVPNDANEDNNDNVVNNNNDNDDTYNNVIDSPKTTKIKRLQKQVKKGKELLAIEIENKQTALLLSDDDKKQQITALQKLVDKQNAKIKQLTRKNRSN